MNDYLTNAVCCAWGPLGLLDTYVYKTEHELPKELQHIRSLRYTDLPPLSSPCEAVMSKRKAIGKFVIRFVIASGIARYENLLACTGYANVWSSLWFSWAMSLLLKRSSVLPTTRRRFWTHYYKKLYAHRFRGAHARLTRNRAFMVRARNCNTGLKTHLLPLFSR